MFRSKPASQFIGVYHNVVSYAFNMEDFVSKKIVNLVIMTFQLYSSVHFIDKLTHFCVILYSFVNLLTAVQLNSKLS